jgi:hypothetical protein
VNFIVLKERILFFVECKKSNFFLARNARQETTTSVLLGRAGGRLSVLLLWSDALATEMKAEITRSMRNEEE